MSEWGNITDILAVNGVAYPIVREVWNFVKYRRRRKDNLEDAMRRDLWKEIASLRAAVEGAQVKLIELLAQHTATIKELGDIQQNFVALGTLLNDALGALGRVEEVERRIDQPDLDKAKAEIASIKREAERIKQTAAVLYQS